MSPELRGQSEVQHTDILRRLDIACGVATPSTSIAGLVVTVINEKFSGNTVRFSDSAKLHRNFVMDMRNGKYRTVRDGHGHATYDPRYTKLGNALGLEAQDLALFLDFVSKCQSYSERGAKVPSGLVIDESITIFRADILRACPNIDPLSLERAIEDFRARVRPLLRVV